MSRAARHPSQSYGQGVTPIGPFVYRTADTPAQFGIPHAIAHGTDLSINAISSPVSPPNSPTVPPSSGTPANHAHRLCQSSVKAVPTDTRPQANDKTLKHTVSHYGKTHAVFLKQQLRPSHFSDAPAAESQSACVYQNHYGSPMTHAAPLNTTISVLIPDKTSPNFVHKHQHATRVNWTADIGNNLGLQCNHTNQGAQTSSAADGRKFLPQGVTYADIMAPFIPFPQTTALWSNLPRRQQTIRLHIMSSK